jgi:hypothetical protein
MSLIAMEYNVPQFIEEQAKILGPFTLRDFFILFGAFLLSAMFFFIFQLWLAIILATILIGSSIALLLVRINGRPLYTIALAALQYFWSPRLYLWKKESLKPEEILHAKPPKPKKEVETKISKPQRLTPEKIKELAKQLDIK